MLLRNVALQLTVIYSTLTLRVLHTAVLVIAPRINAQSLLSVRLHPHQMEEVPLQQVQLQHQVHHPAAQVPLAQPVQARPNQQDHLALLVLLLLLPIKKEHNVIAGQIVS